MDEVKKRPRRSRAAAPTTPDPIEIAMEALASGKAEPGSPAHRVLLRHEQLIGWQIMKERAGFALRCLTGVVGVILAVGLGSLVWSASQERGLVIEPFSVPPEFVEKGITGQVLASRLLDRLSAMSDQTQSVRAPSTYANNWNGDIKVQIPQTGISVGELRRYLVEWLGQQTTIGGELYRTPDGLSLVARTGTATATPLTGADERELDAMIQAAAEQVYATTQPYRWAVYLGRPNGADDPTRSEAAFRALIRSGDKADRMWAYSGLSLWLHDRGDYQGAVDANDAAVAIEPEFPLAYANGGQAQLGAGHDEASYQAYRTALRLIRSDGRRFLRDEGLAFLTALSEARSRHEVGDYGGAVRAYQRALEVVPGDQGATLQLVDALTRLHDLTGARALYDSLSLPVVGAGNATPGQIDRARTIAVAQMALAEEDGPGLARMIAEVDPATLSAGARSRLRNLSYPVLAVGLARMGDAECAVRVAAGTPADCYRCVIARAVAAEASGDRATADRWFAEAIRQAPSLPFAHEERARARLARHDLGGALADFREANRRSPNWADPLKGWGDVLMAQDDPREALRRYSAAAERAPRWAEVRRARERARASVRG